MTRAVGNRCLFTAAHDDVAKIDCTENGPPFVGPLFAAREINFVNIINRSIFFFFVKLFIASDPGTL